MKGLPYPPRDFSGPGWPAARNSIAAFLIFDPEHGTASCSGVTTVIGNPSASSERIPCAFARIHSHEFSHAFSALDDEYLDDRWGGPTSWDATSNVAGTSTCSELPWAHLLHGTTINPDVDQLVGAFGDDEHGYHSELLCLLNGTHDNGKYFGADDGGSCSTSMCTLRVEDRRTSRTRRAS